MLAIALVYWILCSYIRVLLTFGVSGRDSYALLRVDYLFLRFQVDGRIIWKRNGKPEIVLRYGNGKHALHNVRRKHGMKKIGGKDIIRLFRLCEVDAAVFLRLKDAAAAAVTAGAIRTLVSSAAAMAHMRLPRIYLDVKPGEPCFLVNICCVFSARLGDAMFAAAKYALKKSLNRMGKRDSVGKASH